MKTLSGQKIFSSRCSDGDLRFRRVVIATGRTKGKIVVDYIVPIHKLSGVVAR